MKPFFPAVGRSLTTVVEEAESPCWAVACGVRLLLARRLPVRWSVALYVGMEVVLLAVFRDNLILNVTTQFVPIEAVGA